MTSLQSKTITITMKNYVFLEERFEADIWTCSNAKHKKLPVAKFRLVDGKPEVTTRNL